MFWLEQEQKHIFHWGTTYTVYCMFLPLSGNLRCCVPYSTVCRRKGSTCDIALNPKTSLPPWYQHYHSLSPPFRLFLQQLLSGQDHEQVLSLKVFGPGHGIYIYIVRIVHVCAFRLFHFVHKHVTSKLWYFDRSLFRTLICQTQTYVSLIETFFSNSICANTGDRNSKIKYNGYVAVKSLKACPFSFSSSLSNASMATLFSSTVGASLGGSPLVPLDLVVHTAAGISFKVAW